jgi:prespore-specific regulator
MSKSRQDAWSEEDDLLLAETVLRHVREGSTQLRAFEEVGDHLDRTSAAVGFRWNAIVRGRYEQALKIAKRQRKERNRAMRNTNTGYEVPNQSFNGLSENYQSVNTNESINHAEPAQTNMNNFNFTQREMEPIQQPISYSSTESLTMDKVIKFLKQYNESSMQTGVLKKENHRLQEDYNNLLRQNAQMKDEITDLKEKYENVKEDYQAMLQIMDRARRMILLDDDATAPTKFKMDKNGNLEKMAK